MSTPLTSGTCCPGAWSEASWMSAEVGSGPFLPERTNGLAIEGSHSGVHRQMTFHELPLSSISSAWGRPRASPAHLS